MMFMRTVGTDEVRLRQVKTYHTQTWLSPVLARLLMEFMTHKYAQTQS